MGKKFGTTEPRLWTRPLRKLTPETSRGFEVIAFAKTILGVELYPWQKWLLIHGLEILPDGTYRFRRIIVLVARQNGKTLLGSVLTAWWLFMDSSRFPQQVPPFKFKIVGVAQNLDIAAQPYEQVVLWANPEPASDEDREQAIPILQAETSKVSHTNGKQYIRAKNLAHYEIKASVNARGKPAARILMDEMREQKDFASWNAVSLIQKSFFNGQLWGISNAGSSHSVVLRKQYELGLELIESYDKAIAAGQSAQEWADANDKSFGLFDWSAPDGADPLDEAAILQANPSIGHGAMSIETCRSDYSTMLEADYRTEVLCQWVAADVVSYIDVKDWRALEVKPVDVHIRKGERTVWGIDMSVDRSTVYVAAATTTTSGKPFVTVREARPGSLWVVPYMQQLAKESGQREVVIQARGNPAMEFISPLKEAGLDVHELEGSWFGIATGRIRDRVRSGGLIVVDQPAVGVAVAGGITKRFGETDAWSRTGSQVDIAPLVAITLALYGLEVLEPTQVLTSAYESAGLMIL
ncbi:hypothetical protein [Arcanobacterium canis]